MKRMLYLLVWLLCGGMISSHNSFAQNPGGESELITAKQAAQNSLDLARDRFDAGAILVQVQFEEQGFGGSDSICNHLTGAATSWTSTFYMPTLDSVYSISLQVFKPGILQFRITMFPGDFLADAEKIPVADNWQDSDYLFQQFRNDAIISDWLADYQSPVVSKVRIHGNRFEIGMYQRLMGETGPFEACRCEGDVIAGVPDDCSVTTGLPHIAETALFSISSISPQPANAATSELAVALFSPDHAALEVSITDIVGKNIVDVYNGDLNRGENTIRLPLGTLLRSGVYFLVFRRGTEVLYKPVAIIR